jgi:hypothetical protein
MQFEKNIIIALDFSIKDTFSVDSKKALKIRTVELGVWGAMHLKLNFPQTFE